MQSLRKYACATMFYAGFDFLLFTNVFSSGLVFGMERSIQRAGCMKDSIYKKASHLLTSADNAAAVRDGQRVVELIDQGIAEMGDNYLAKDTVDDTPLKLTLAQAKFSQGDLKEAIGLKKSVLISRLEMYKSKICN